MTVRASFLNDGHQPSSVRVVSDHLPRHDDATPNSLGIGQDAQQTRGETDPHLLGLFQRHSFVKHFQPNSTLLLHGDRADTVYLTISGTVRCCTIDPEGRRQIFSFSRKDDMVGISDFDRWHFTAEAVDHVIVNALPRSVIEQEIATNIDLRQEIRTRIGDMLAQRERQLLLLSTTTGPDRLYRFLSDFAATRGTQGFVVLPMCRRDIGDHIGLSTEGVSRAFGRLKSNGVIELRSSDRFRIVSPNKAHVDTLSR